MHTCVREVTVNKSKYARLSNAMRNLGYGTTGAQLVASKATWRDEALIGFILARRETVLGFHCPTRERHGESTRNCPPSKHGEVHGATRTEVAVAQLHNKRRFGCTLQGTRWENR